MLVVGVLAPLLGASAGTEVQPRLRLTAEERYDDDLLLREESGATFGELMTKLSPRVGLELKNPTLEFDGWYAADLQLRHLSRTVRLDHRAGLELNQRLSRLTSIDAELGVWRVTDPTSLPRMGVGRTLDPVLYGRGEVGLDSQLSRRWLSRVAYAFEGTRVYTPETPLGMAHAPSAELLYRLSPRSSAGLGYRFQYFVFGPETATAHTPEALFRYQLDKFTGLALRAGPVAFGQNGGALGVAPKLDVNIYRRVRRMDFGLVAGQDVVGASGFSNALWAQYAGLHTGWTALEDLRIWAGASVFRNGDAPGTFDEYVGPDGPGISSGYALGAGAEWELHQHLMIQGQLDRVVQAGVFGPGGDLARNIAAVRLVLRAW